jgi:peptidoglycan hydrolase-like amidase
VRKLSEWTVVALTAAAVVASLVVAAPPATAAIPPDARINISGHGWGHGRGMGQWGAVGYAVNYGSSAEAILDHFYGGHTTPKTTTLFKPPAAGAAGNPVVGIRLAALSGRDMIVTSSAGNLRVSAPQGELTRGQTAVRVNRVAPGVLRVETGPGCGGPWTAVADAGSGPVAVDPLAVRSYDDLVQVCEGSQTRAYRGQLVSLDAGGAQQNVNYVPLDDYLAGVVPRELSASVGDLGGGRGQQALMAQAVAARSYALSENRYPPYAKTCDTESCQVYRGAATRPFGGALTVLEDSRTTRAVQDTSGWVRRMGQNDPGAAIARTEFSSSTGGWSAGGVFPAVPDLGDDISLNTRHNWTVTKTAAQIASALGVSSMTSIQVTRRNGLGDMGGRATELVVGTPDRGFVSFTGDQARSRLGLNSDWFWLQGAPTEQDLKFVDALYLDFLGRPADPAGRDGWAGALATGSLSRQGVAMGLASTDEWLGHVVDGLYAQFLRRGPDPSGRAYWIAALRQGVPVANIAAGLLASDEYYSRFGSSTDDGWVASVYVDVLGRQASASERDGWVRAVRSAGRANTAVALYQSAESRSARVQNLYLALLGRPADPTGLSGWTDFLLHSGDIVLASYLASSDEYYARAQTR